jgi:hypothetical protein
MVTRPILFGGPMVRAILAGRKTQTRRVIRYAHADGLGLWTAPPLGGYFAEHVFGACYAKLAPCPYGVPGDRLWVREAWADHVGPFGESRFALYRADGDERAGPWRPSIFMPRWASRITLEVTAVRVERLQQISEEDAKAEGMEFDGTWWLGGTHPVKGTLQCWPTAAKAFERGWDSINGKRAPWDANPWVWAIAFRSAA